MAVILKETGLDPRCLELEITESLLMEDAETNFRMLSELKDTVSGLRIAIDDLETGYSSLYRLKTFLAVCSRSTSPLFGTSSLTRTTLFRPSP